MNIKDLITPPYLYILIGVVVLVAIIVLVVCLIIKKKNKKKDENQKNEIFDNIVLALGGRENIVSSEAKGSRLNVVLNDYTVVDEDKIKENGVSSIIKMTSKLTLIVGYLSEELSNYLKK